MVSPRWTSSLPATPRHGLSSSRCSPTSTTSSPKEDQLARLTRTSDISEAARKVLACGVHAVQVSRGEHGCSLVTSAQPVDYPAFPAQAVDTTGCGDTCSAGFIVGLLRGWPLEDAPLLAMAAASLDVGGLGSDAGIFDLDCTLGVIR